MRGREPAPPPCLVSDPGRRLSRPQPPRWRHWPRLHTQITAVSPRGLKVKRGHSQTASPAACPVRGVDDVVLARPRGCTRYGDDVETVYYCVQYTGAVIDVSRHVIVSQWNERKSEWDKHRMKLRRAC